MTQLSLMRVAQLSLMVGMVCTNRSACMLQGTQRATVGDAADGPS